MFRIFFRLKWRFHRVYFWLSQPDSKILTGRAQICESDGARKGDSGPFAQRNNVGHTKNNNTLYVGHFTIK